MSDVGSHRMLLNKTNHIFERLAIEKKNVCKLSVILTGMRTNLQTRKHFNLLSRSTFIFN